MPLGGSRCGRQSTDLGDLAVELPALGARSELRAKVYAPVGAAGKRPLVVFEHGFHSVCTGETQVWPCPPGETAVPSFRGYDAPAEALASHGYLVVSISANAVNAGGGRTADRGGTARGELVLAHLDLWRRGRRPMVDRSGTASSVGSTFTTWV